MGNNPSPEAVNRVYNDFEPHCKWHHRKELVTMDAELKDFKKQQIHVRTEKGNLVITGERAIDPPKWERFRKEIKLQRDWNEEGIRAQLSSSGTLSIIIPKRETFVLKFRNSLSTVTSKMMTYVPRLQVPSGSNFSDSVGMLVPVLNLLMLVVVILCLYYICFCNTNTYT